MPQIVLAITLGDPGGIGPEIALKAVCGQRWPAHLRLALIGARALLVREARRLRLPLPPAVDFARQRIFPAPVVNWEPGGNGTLPKPLAPIPSRQMSSPRQIRPGGKNKAWGTNAFPSLEGLGVGSSSALNLQPFESTPDPTGATSRAPWPPGAGGRSQGQAAARWIEAAVAGCRRGLFDGMVTGPVSKKSLQLAGLPFPGHTEYLAALTQTRRYAMLLMGGPLRVTLVTRHLPLARVAPALTRSAIMEAAELTEQALRWLGEKNLTIGVCALNPHAGDQGVLGREESTTIIPAIRALQRRGIKALGPIPADVIFHQAIRGKFGAVLAMYHDQGLAPLKMLAFESGINLTLGLPILRTSPDHGTAFDIAGKGIADPGSMIAAIMLAARLARRKNPFLSERR
jgi:4-hydroxythreonine-4-phosphate dehydrogenase